MKKVLAFILSTILLMSIAVPVAFAQDDAIGEKEYTITNPYATVDWETWGQYKANLHAHSTYSDGEVLLADVIEEFYERGYDILAITDHGVVNQGWDTIPELMPLISYNQYIGNIKPVSSERYLEITTGADRDGRGMLDVPLGIEMNAVVVNKNHVNGFFCGYGQNYWGTENDYETVIKGTHEAGGLSFINHPGDWLKSSSDVSKATDPDNIFFFGRLFVKYDSCVGFEVFNGRDSSTRNDRVLWDELLQFVLPHGRNIWGFANDDSHSISHIGTAEELFLMPENTVEALRTAMEDGTFFACSKYARNEIGDDFVGTGEYATVSNITVDDTTNQITVEAENYDTIQWIANGEIIAEGATIDLNNYEDDITCYVRAQLINEGGIVLTQAFVVDDGTLYDDVEPIVDPEIDNSIIGIIKRMIELFKNTLIVAGLMKLFS